MALGLKTWSGGRAEGWKSVSTRSYKFLKISRAYKIYLRKSNSKQVQKQVQEQVQRMKSQKTEEKTPCTGNQQTTEGADRSDMAINESKPDQCPVPLCEASNRAVNNNKGRYEDTDVAHRFHEKACKIIKWP